MIITREVFDKWASVNMWMQVKDQATVDGHQITFLTPFGNMIIVIFNIKGEFLAVGQMVAAPQQPSPLGIKRS